MNNYRLIYVCFSINRIICERYEGRFGCTVSKSSMDRALRQLKVTRKKTTVAKRAR
jgi:hypothetical protein